MEYAGCSSPPARSLRTVVPLAASTSTPAAAASSNTLTVTATEYTYKVSGLAKAR